MPDGADGQDGPREHEERGEAQHEPERRRHLDAAQVVRRAAHRFGHGQDVQAPARRARRVL